MKLISDSAKTMGTLIDDLLHFSRMGRAELRRMDVNLTTLTREVIRDTERDTQGRHVIWKCHPLPVVKGDPNLLRQVMN